MNLILGVFLGGLLGIGSVVIAEYLRDTVLTPRELEVLTGKQVLASVPHMRQERQRILVKTARESEPKAAEDVTPQPRLSQPKLVHDPVFEWASGE